VRHAAELALGLFPDLAADTTLLDRIILLSEEAFKLADDVYTMKDAEDWGENFVIPSHALQTDIEDYAATGYKLEALAECRQQAVSANRLSSQRPPMRDVLSPDNPEIELLQKLADEGFSLLVDPTFVPNSSLGIRPPLRQKYLETKSAVNKLIYDNFHKQGLAVVLPLSEIEKGDDSRKVHISPFSWAPKSGTPKGRPIGDCSDGGVGAQPLNSDYTKAETDRVWGVITHPTIGDISVMVNNFLSNDPPSILPDDEFVLWKMDLKGAYTLLSLRSKDVVLFGMEMTDSLVMFFLCGIFGWTGTPACFQVVTRAIAFELGKRLIGKALMYVDDIFGICRRRDLAHELAVTKAVCESILGTNSVEDKKTEVGRRLTVIGYEIDIELRLVAVARKNVLKALHGFLTTDLNSNTTVKSLQKLASWGSRYAEICRYMKPFTKALYSAYAGKRVRNTFPLTKPARVSILVFRVLLSLTSVLEKRFTRSLSSFVPSFAHWIVEFDASLSGIGLLWFHRENSESTEVLLGGCSLDITSLGFGDNAAFQNTAEFIAAAMGVRGLMAFGDVNNARIEFRGDSVSALTWAMKRVTRSATASNASIFYALQCMALGVEITSTTHLQAADNWRADMLSRGKSVADLGELDGRFANDAVPTVNLDADKILRLCNPGLDPTVDEGGFLAFWTEVRNATTDVITTSFVRR